MKMAIIGCGNIAKAHVLAMRDAGFDICSIAGSLNSTNVDNFAKQNKIDKTYKDPLKLIENKDEWDVMLLIPSTSVMIDYLKLLAPIGKPILVEKPISHNYLDLKYFIKYKNVQVAYNRRFYNGVKFAKDFIKTNSDILMKITIPEYRKDPEHNAYFPNNLPVMSYENSVHMFDIANYIAGKITWDYVKNIKNNDKFIALSAIGHSDKGVYIQIDSYYNASDNFSIHITSNDKTIQMKPIEITTLFSGMEVKEPTDKVPIRTYSPILKEQIIDSGHNNHKPGFYEQAKDFMNFALNKKSIGADISDAYNALEVAHNLTSDSK